MKKIKGSKTEQNLMIAFAGESMTANRYLYFAEIAEKEGYQEIADAFGEVSGEEQGHARALFKFFAGGAVEVTATFPAAGWGDTKSNLEAAIRGENATWTVRYPEFERTAREEGFVEIAEIFRIFANSERGHEELFRKKKDLITNS
ncbi:MAG TPA: rubrerythrin family protein [Thermovirgaceae bacterium]|nr:rubrerythrin family protein [Thermovirgaceae bacterium]